MGREKQPENEKGRINDKENVKKKKEIGLKIKQTARIGGKEHNRRKRREDGEGKKLSGSWSMVHFNDSPFGPRGNERGKGFAW